MSFLVLAETKKGGGGGGGGGPMLIDPTGLSSWVKFWYGFFELIKLETNRTLILGYLG